MDFNTPWELLLYGWTMGVTSSAVFYYAFMFAGAVKWFGYWGGD